MNIKEFFKPTIAKIVIFIIIFVFFVPFIEPYHFVCVKAPCPQPGAQSIATQYLFLRNPVVGIYYSNFFIGIIVSYFVSCLVVYFIAKLRKTKSQS